MTCRSTASTGKPASRARFWKRSGETRKYANPAGPAGARPGRAPAGPAGFAYFRVSPERFQNLAREAGFPVEAVERHVMKLDGVEYEYPRDRFNYILRAA